MNITIPQALAISGIALLIIMAVLCCIMGIIYIMGFSIRKTEGKSLKDLFKGSQNDNSSEANNTTDVVQQNISTEDKTNLSGSLGSVKLINVNEKDAALIMAIVAHNSGIELNKLIFKSIKELKGDN